MNKEFTFVTVTYNQQAYIYRHLQSIRYQIEHFATGYNIYLIVCDDCSSDDTVQRINEWLNDYGYLFKSINVIRNTENLGVVLNISNALSLVNTRKFKLLAGDDIYYKNSVFDLPCNGNYYISPVIYWDGSSASLEKRVYIKELLFLKSNSKRIKYMKREMRIHNVPSTPGVFYDKTRIDGGLFRALKGFSLIEDIPMWNYMISQNDVVTSVLSKPLVIYYQGAGISTNIHNVSRDERYESDSRLIAQNICVDCEKNKYRLGYMYLRFLTQRIHSAFYGKNNDIHNLDIISQDIDLEVREYIRILDGGDV